MAEAMGATRLDIRSNSQLVVNQVTKEYEPKDNRMEKYLHKVRAVFSVLVHLKASTSGRKC